MLNGKYVSYYDNGTKKSEGAFKDNQRVGEWLVWDKDGNKRMIRKYDNNYTFETVLAKNGKGVDAPSAKINYVFKRSSNGAIIDNKITEKDVAVSKRIWRSIENNTNNKILFDNNLLVI
jgi:antitoxin component YwqK of YwqJK toxin-antitoxin module